MNSFNNKLNKESVQPVHRTKTMIQPKLTINTPGDVYEQEADAMADQVMRNSFIDINSERKTGLIGNSVQKKLNSSLKDKNSVLKRKESVVPGIVAPTALQHQINSSGGRGTNLPDNTRKFMKVHSALIFPK